MSIIALALVLCSSLKAQTWAEWFRQKQTQKKYLLQQIALLRVHFSYVKKGYDIANKGIITISNIKKGDFNLHSDFFGSLKIINPKIKKYLKLADVIAYEAGIIKYSSQTIKSILSKKQFTPQELYYCQQVLKNLLAESAKVIDEVLMVITANQVEMKDDERLKRIDKCYDDMQDKYSFCISFSEELGMLSVRRLAEQVEIDHVKILKGLK